MRRNIRQLILCGVSLILTASALADNDQKVLPDRPERGIQIFTEKNCIKCHSIWGVGGTMGPDLPEAVRGRDFYQVIGLLWNHSPRMFLRMEQEGIPAQGMNATEMNDLIAFLYYLNFFAPPGDYGRGETLFKSKNCIQCHSLGEGKSKAGPSLDKFGLMISPVFLGTYLWNHREGMATVFKMNGIELPVFDQSDLADILAYIRGESIDETENRKYLEPGNPDKGRSIFEEKKCNQCHAVFGKGGKRAPDLGTTQLSKNTTEIIGILWNHLDKMGKMYKELGLQLPKFEPQEMADLLTYLYFNDFYDENGDTARGQVVYQEKGCMTCHSVPGKEGKLAPDLAASDVIFEPFDFAARIWNHTQKMGIVFEESLIVWPIFSDDEMRDLIFYLKSKSKTEP